MTRLTATNHDDALDMITRIMAEPERDDGGVDSGLEQAHRGGVAQHVSGDSLGVQLRAMLCSGGGVLGESVFERVAAEDRAGAGREQGIVWLAFAFP